MARRMIFPLLFGILGVAILVSLGNWQMRRLAWKEALLAEIESRLSAPPVALPAAPDPEKDRYLAVTLRGRIEPPALFVLTSREGEGPGFRVISPLVTEGGRRVLLDRGFVPERARARVAEARGPLEVEGNLDWPREADSYTPEPDRARGIWFARDVPRMAAELGTEPVLVVARRIDPPDAVVTPAPVDTASIRNPHLGYAIQWYGMALVWAGMTLYWLWRIRRRGG